MEHFRLTPLLLAGVLVTASVPYAFAFEADEVAERLKQVLSRQQAELTYDSAQLDGNDVTLEGVIVKSADADEGLPLGTLTLENVSEEEDGSFRVGTLAMDNFEHEEGDITISLGDLVISGLVLPDDAETDPFGGELRYERMEVARFAVDGKDGPIASAQNLHADLTVSEEDATMDATGAVESFSLNLGSMAGSGNAAAMLQELGYGEVAGSAVMEGSWRASDGRVILSRYETKLDDAGTLGITLDFAGYTPDFARSLEELGHSMDQASGDSMQGMAVFGLLQQLTFHGAVIRFTDDSLAGKVLDYIADQQGGTPADIIAQAKAAIPPQLSPFVGAEMAGNVAEAVADFLENPGNIEISAQPDDPMPFAMLMMAMASPEMLVRQIGLAVRANQ